MGLEKEAGDCSQRGQLSRLSKKMPQENQRIPQRDNFWFTFKWLGRTGRNLAPLDPQLQDAAEKKPEDCQLHLTKNHGPEVIGAETRMEPTEKLPHGRHKQKRKHSSRRNQRNQLYSRRHRVGAQLDKRPMRALTTHSNSHIDPSPSAGNMWTVFSLAT